MHIIYLHGFNSTSQSVKGRILANYVKEHKLAMSVHTPDLNMRPAKVLECITMLIDELSAHAPVVLIGSSFGGYYATHLSNQTGCAALLLNPSVQPHKTLTRFFADGKEEGQDDEVFFTTVGNWQVTYGDINWVEHHPLTEIKNPNNMAVWLKMADEVLDYKVAEDFYGSCGVKSLIVHEGGDHRIMDFEEHLPMVMDVLQSFVK